jgi:hypothetical protein
MADKLKNGAAYTLTLISKLILFCPIRFVFYSQLNFHQLPVFKQ